MNATKIAMNSPDQEVDLEENVLGSFDDDDYLPESLADFVQQTDAALEEYTQLILDERSPLGFTPRFMKDPKLQKDQLRASATASTFSDADTVPSPPAGADRSQEDSANAQRQLFMGTDIPSIATMAELASTRTLSVASNKDKMSILENKKDESFLEEPPDNRRRPPVSFEQEKSSPEDSGGTNRRRPPVLLKKSTSKPSFFGNSIDDSTYHEHALGGFATSAKKSEVAEIESPVGSILTFGFNTKTLIACLVMFILCWLLPNQLLNAEPYLTWNEPGVQFKFYATIFSSIPIVIFMTWAGLRIIPPEYRTSTDSGFLASISPGRSSILLILCVMLGLMVTLVIELVKPEHQNLAFYLVYRALAFTMFTFWVSLLDDGVLLAQNFADKTEAIVKTSPNFKRGRKWTKNMSYTWDSKIDKACSIPGGSRSPARVLAEVIGVYCTLGKAGGFIFLFLFMVGVNLYSSLVAFGLSALFLAVINALHINNALSNLLPMAISNSIHLGEIVSLVSGTLPAGNPKIALTGFIEGITWSNVVIRDFKRMQVFVPHSEMHNYTLYNWSRRPNKQLMVEIMFNVTHGGGINRVVTLQKFTKKWIKANPEIDQVIYQGVKVGIDKEGRARLRVIAYPNVGISLDAVRTELTTMIFEAAERLKLSLLESRYHARDIDDLWNIQNVDTSKETMADDATSFNTNFNAFSDLMPDKLKGRYPKSKKA